MKTKEFLPIKIKNNRLFFLDQTLLPGIEKYIEIETFEDAVYAIKKLIVRGAPAIGVAAAYSVWRGTFEYIREKEIFGIITSTSKEAKNLSRFFYGSCKILAEARPTAVNLEWAVNRMEKVFRIVTEKKYDVKTLLIKLKEEADLISNENQECCKKISEYGLTLLSNGSKVLTHCNAGVLATNGYGTALGPLHLAVENGIDVHAFVDETRPLLQGARLTAWELVKSGIDTTVICDNMASILMKQGKVDMVFVGCDRMAANGDGANKIGTSGIAILAKEYKIPFYMFLPVSTIDFNIKCGKEIVIEERTGEEIGNMWYKKPMTPSEVKFFNPAFDVTDNKYITAIVTERGIIKPPFRENLEKLRENWNV